jgi:hypothetical protein
MRMSVDKWAQNLGEELDMRVQGTRINMQVTNTLIEAK